MTQHHDKVVRLRGALHQIRDLLLCADDLVARDHCLAGLDLYHQLYELCLLLKTMLVKLGQTERRTWNDIVGTSRDGSPGALTCEHPDPGETKRRIAEGLCSIPELEDLLAEAPGTYPGFAEDLQLTRERIQRIYQIHLSTQITHS